MDLKPNIPPELLKDLRMLIDLADTPLKNSTRRILNEHGIFYVGQVVGLRGVSPRLGSSARKYTTELENVLGDINLRFGMYSNAPDWFWQNRAPQNEREAKAEIEIQLREMFNVPAGAVVTYDRIKEFLQADPALTATREELELVGRQIKTLNQELTAARAVQAQKIADLSQVSVLDGRIVCEFPIGPAFEAAVKHDLVLQEKLRQALGETVADHLRNDIK